MEKIRHIEASTAGNETQGPIGSRIHNVHKSAIFNRRTSALIVHEQRSYAEIRMELSEVTF